MITLLSFSGKLDYWTVTSYNIDNLLLVSNIFVLNIF